MVTLEETTEVFLKSCNYKTVEEFFQGFLNKTGICDFTEIKDRPKKTSCSDFKERS